MKVVRMTQVSAKGLYVLFDASSLAIGDTISLDIYIKKPSEYVIIIEAGTKLTEKLYNLLKKQDNLYILDNLNVRAKKRDVHLLSGGQEKCDIDYNTLLTRIKRDKNNFSKTLQLLYAANNQLFYNFLHATDNKIDFLLVDAIVESIIFLIQKNEHYLKNIMPTLQNDYKMPIHSFNVTLYSLHIGVTLKFDNKQLIKLGQAALLHDVGKKDFCSIVNKNGMLTPEELELTKKLPLYSVEILKQNNITDDSVIDAVKQHHERYDGSGYPDQLLKSEITDFASIIAICNVFDALTVYKPNRTSYTTFEALKVMLQDTSMKNKFNNEYIKLLLV